MLVLGFPDYDSQAHALARALNVPYQGIELHRFPDGESRLRLPPALSGHVLLCRSLDHPNAKLIELLIAAESARTLGARQLTLVAPYLCYMRQDKAFQPGEAVSQAIVGQFLAEIFDGLVTVDPHLHRVRSLSEAVPVKRPVAVSAATAMGEFLAVREGVPLLVGPDAESEQWVRSVATRASLDYIVAHKRRFGDRRVEVTLPRQDFSGRDIVIVDDMASTGQTLAETARAVRSFGAGHVDVLVTHALFNEDALATLDSAGVREIWTSDSIHHPTNAFALAPLLAAAIE